jgi:hypothetical protein
MYTFGLTLHNDCHQILLSGRGRRQTTCFRMSRGGTSREVLATLAKAGRQSSSGMFQFLRARPRNTKIHALAHSKGRPVAMLLTG